MDATALTSAAAALDTHAEVLRARAHLVARQRDAMRWHSPAARRCRALLDTLCVQLLATGAALGDLAERLRRCAVRVANAS